MKPEPQTERESLFYRRLHREYIFYVLAFNAVERIKRTVLILFYFILFYFPSCCIFSYQYCTDLKKHFFCVCCLHHEDWFHSEDDVVRAWYLLYIVWPLYIYISGCDHLCLFFLFLFFNFLLQALLSALCLNLTLDRMYSFDLQWQWNNDKIRMVNQHFCVCLLLASFWVSLSLFLQWKQGCFFF